MAMAENDELDLGVDSPDDTPLIKQLRQQLKQQSKELATYRQEKRASVFEQAGIDPNTWAGKQAVKEYDGELDAEKIREWAAAEGVPLAEPTAQQATDVQTEQRADATARIDQLRQTSAPVGGQKVSLDDYMRLSQSNPGEAQRLSEAGLVERPSIAQLLNG